MLKVKIICCAVLAACLAVTAAPYQTFKMDKKNYVPFDNTTTVTVDCPDPAAVQWLAAHLAEWYGAYAPKVVAAGGARDRATADAQERVPSGDEAYAAETGADGAKIAARTLAGVRWAAYTLRQLAIAKRGTFKTEGWIIPALTISDRPHLAFRAVHLCWFPEVRPQQIERAIRLAALLKFNYAIIEPWGMYKSEKHPWWCWPQANMTKAEVRRLVAVGRDLGITLIPQINCYGHATSARGRSLKHSALDLHPEYEPLFEPDGWSSGWNWCLSNPETQRVLRELIAEMHENFGNPPYFHIGCDEADRQTCPDCVKTPNSELVLRHITGLAEFVRSRGARDDVARHAARQEGSPLEGLYRVRRRRGGVHPRPPAEGHRDLRLAVRRPHGEGRRPLHLAHDDVFQGTGIRRGRLSVDERHVDEADVGPSREDRRVRLHRDDLAPPVRQGLAEDVHGRRVRRVGFARVARRVVPALAPPRGA